MLSRLFLAVLISVLALGCSNENGSVVKIAFIGPLTGGVSANGIGGRNSADLAIKLANADIEKKYKYELVALDDECKPNIGIQVATKVAADNSIKGVVAHYCSAVAVGTVDVFHKFSAPMIVWGAVLPEITYGNVYREIHRVNGTMINQNDVAAKFMVDLGYKEWAIIHDTTDYGKGHNQFFTQSLEKYGGTVLGRFGVTADQQDFNAELTKIKALNPEVIYFGGITPIGVRIRTQMERLNVSAVFQGTSGIISDAFIEGAGTLSEGTLAFREGDSAERLPGGKMFLAEYAKQNYSSPPEAYGPFAFAATNLLIDAIESEGPSRKKIITYLNKVNNYDSVIGKITFDNHGQNMVPLITKFVVEDGSWKVWETSDYVTKDRLLSRQPNSKKFQKNGN